MEEDITFDDLFTLADNDYALKLLERLFGGIVYVVDGSGTGDMSENWLSIIFSIFNTTCLLAMIVLTSYTLYVLIFDTAADGRVFGEQTDTKYTLLRAFMGAVAFVPVSGGYSLGQVGLIWLVVQGSAFGDTVWTKTADMALSGTSLLAAPADTTENDYPIQMEFAKAFDALTNGYVCAYNANAIYGMVSGSESYDVTAGPMSLQSPSGVIVSDSISNWTAEDGGATGLLTYYQKFGTSSGNSSYNGRDNFCGGVTRSVQIDVGGCSDGWFSFCDGDDTSAFRKGVATTQITARFGVYKDVMDDLADNASDLALSIYNGERDMATIEAAAGAAVRSATNGMISGVSSYNSISNSTLDSIHEQLLDDATTYGWVFAPAWQRGIAMAGSWNGSAFDDFEIETFKNNSISAYLRGAGVRTGYDPTVEAMLSKAEEDARTWELMQGSLMSLGEPGSGADFNPLAVSTTDDGVKNAQGWLYSKLLSFLSVREGLLEESAVYSDPMVDVVSLGKWMTGGGLGVMGAGVAADFIPMGKLSKVAGALTGADPIGEVTSAIKAVGWTIFVSGFVMMAVIPLIPFAYFYSAVISWVMLIVEAMFALPLAVLTFFTPAREKTLVGSWNKILLTLFGLFFRPFFTVVGLLFGMMVMSFALGYLYDLFYGLMMFVVPGASVFGLVSLTGLLVVFAIITLLTVIHASAIVTELGDGAMNWLGITFSTLGAKMAVGDAAVQTGQMPGKVLGSFNRVNAPNARSFRVDPNKAAALPGTSRGGRDISAKKG